MLQLKIMKTSNEQAHDHYGEDSVESDGASMGIHGQTCLW